MIYNITHHPAIRTEKNSFPMMGSSPSGLSCEGNLPDAVTHLLCDLVQDSSMYKCILEKKPNNNPNIPVFFFSYMFQSSSSGCFNLYVTINCQITFTIMKAIYP